MEEKRTDKQASPILDVPTPNDQRSIVFNSTSPAFKAALDNRSTQLNPNSQAYRSSRGGGRKK
ncbi:MAG: hypothetical protein ABSD73_07960 [Candidatus Bathyarchaeia archaeon]